MTDDLRGRLDALERAVTDADADADIDFEGVADAATVSDRLTALETRNVNVFSVPYGDAVDAVFDADVDTVRLHTAALTLRAAENTAEDTPRLTTSRDALRAEVNSSLGVVRNRTLAVLARETTLSASAREQAVTDAFATWERPAGRALAVTNGSFVPRVVNEARLDGQEADWVTVHLRVAVAEARTDERVRVHQTYVDPTATTVRQLTKTAATEALGTAVANGTERLATKTNGKAVVLPAGLPLLPTPTNWYATVNVWVVHVRGGYERFAVRTQRGVPGETVTYVRDGGCARLDIDEDGVPDDVGCASHVDFSVRTVVVVAVPPGKLGVGDTDGQTVEDSPGWGTEP